MVFQQKVVTPTEFEAFVSQLNIPNYIESEESDLPDLKDEKIGFEMSLSRIDYNRITNGKKLNEVIDVDVVVMNTVIPCKELVTESDVWKRCATVILTDVYERHIL